MKIGECRQVVTAMVCGTIIRGFESRHLPFFDIFLKDTFVKKKKLFFFLNEFSFLTYFELIGIVLESLRRKNKKKWLDT